MAPATEGGTFDTPAQNGSQTTPALPSHKERSVKEGTMRQGRTPRVWRHVMGTRNNLHTPPLLEKQHGTRQNAIESAPETDSVPFTIDQSTDAGNLEKVSNDNYNSTSAYPNQRVAIQEEVEHGWDRAAINNPDIALSQPVVRLEQEGGEAATSVLGETDQPHTMAFEPQDPNKKQHRQVTQGETPAGAQHTTHGSPPLRPLTPPKAMQPPEDMDPKQPAARTDYLPQYVMDVAGTHTAADSMDVGGNANGTMPQPQHPQAINGGTQNAYGAYVRGDMNEAADYPTVKNRAEKLAVLAMFGNDAQPQTLAEAQANLPPKKARGNRPTEGVLHGEQGDTPVTGILRPSDFAVAFGSPNDGRDIDYHKVADAFTKAWEADGDVLRYDGAYPMEAEAPPDRNSRAASGWQPMPQTQAVGQSFPVPPDRHTEGESVNDNELFEAYGASYKEAYAVALAMEFSEEKPLPNDDIGDVMGPVNSILHTPSGEPILLGTMGTDDAPDTGTSDNKEDVLASSADTLSTGRKVVRYLLLVLGMAAVTVAGLYFAGYLL